MTASINTHSFGGQHLLAEDPNTVTRLCLKSLAFLMLFAAKALDGQACLLCPCRSLIASDALNLSSSDWAIAVDEPIYTLVSAMLYC